MKSVILGALFLLSSVGFAGPENDDFANRTLIASLPASIAANTASATTEAGDLADYYSLWWKFTPEETGEYFITIEPVVSTYVVFGVYTGDSLGSLDKINSTFESGRMPNEQRYRYELIADTEYSILLGSSRSWEKPDVTLLVSRNKAPSIDLVSPSGSQIYYAGTELQLLVNADDPDGSVSRVDYYIGPNVSGTPIATSSVYPFSASITLPESNYYEQVTAVAVDDEGTATVSSKVTFLVTFFIENDLFENRTPLIGDFAMGAGNNRYATNESSEPSGNKSIWWSWTASEDKKYTIRASSWPGSYNPRLDVYTGITLPSLQRLKNASTNSYTAQVDLDAIAGQTYQFRVTTVGGIGGSTVLALFPADEELEPLEQFGVKFESESDSLVFQYGTSKNRSHQIFSSPNLQSWSPYTSELRGDGANRRVQQKRQKTKEFYKLVANDLVSQYSLDERFAHRIMSEGDPDVTIEFESYSDGRVGAFRAVGLEDGLEVILSGGWLWEASSSDLDSVSFKYIVSDISVPSAAFSGSPMDFARETDEQMPVKDEVRISYTGEDVGSYEGEVTLTDGSIEPYSVISVDFR